MSYNPYDLLLVKIDGIDLYARVIELDSEIKDVVKSTNADGKYVVPKRIITICSKCGQPIEVEVSLPQPPFPTVQLSCESCYPAPVEVCAFIDPITSGRMTLADLNPSDIPVTTKPSIDSIEGFKLERFKRVVDKMSILEETFSETQESTSLEPAEVGNIEAAVLDESSKKAQKKQKKTPNETDLG